MVYCNDANGRTSNSFTSFLNCPGSIHGSSYTQAQWWDTLHQYNFYHFPMIVVSEGDQKHPWFAFTQRYSKYPRTQVPISKCKNIFHHLPAVCQGSKYYHPKQYISHYSVEIPQILPYFCICLIPPSHGFDFFHAWNPNLRIFSPPGHSFFLAFARTIQSTQSRIVGDHVGFTIGRLHLLQNSLAGARLVVEPTHFEKIWVKLGSSLPGIRGKFLKNWNHHLQVDWCFCYPFPNSGEEKQHPCLGIKCGFLMPFWQKKEDWIWLDPGWECLIWSLHLEKSGTGAEGRLKLSSHPMHFSLFLWHVSACKNDNLHSERTVTASWVLMLGKCESFFGQHIGGTQNCSGWRHAPSSHITMHHKHGVLAIWFSYIHW